VTQSGAPPLVPAGRPRLVGIVNITEDSFSDGGRYLAAADALAHARQLRSEGADIIELGPAASHPDSARVTAEEEQRRLAPVLGPLTADGIPVSVDSFQPETQRFAISCGATYLNDVQGFPHPGLYGTLAASGCRLVVMHSVQRTGPATRVVTDPAAIWAGVGRFFAGRLAALQSAGITRDRLIIDPGLGYFLGSNPEPSLAALAGIGELKARFGVPVLVSPSRKSFLRTLTGCSIANAGPASLAAELYAASYGADYIRTHDVTALRDALTVLTAIARQASPAPEPANAGVTR
jgi:dihydropteroate synthase type 2